MQTIILLSEKQIQAANQQETPYKLSDGAGLYLYISPSGGKSWRFAYRASGKRKTLSYGVYPDVSLKQAREYHTAARQQLSKGVDPAAQKQQEKLQSEQDEQRRKLTFEVVARDWFQTQQAANSEKTRKGIWGRLELHIFPVIGRLPFADVSFEHFRSIVRRLERKGKYEMARRVANIITQICRHDLIVGQTSTKLKTSRIFLRNVPLEKRKDSPPSRIKREWQ